METVFRTQPKVDSGIETPLPTEGKVASGVSTTKEEVPYLDYSKEHGMPHTALFFELGDRWADATGGFPKEVETIENYFREKITSGEMANSVMAVKDRLKEILKVTNMTKEERNLIKIETVAAYVKFLMEGDNIKQQVKRYGNPE
jgi:hypothetical protein